MFHRIALLIVLIGNSMGCSVPDTTPIQQWRHVEEGELGLSGFSE